MDQIEEKMWLLLKDIEESLGSDSKVYAHAYDLYVDIYDLQQSQKKEQK